MLSSNNNLYSSDGLVINYQDGDQSLVRVPIEFINDIEDKSHIVIEGDTLTSLSHFYLGSSRNWWKIADRNNLDDIWNLEIGSEIIIPNPNKYK